MIKVGIIGATGYVGAELMRILLNHKKIEISAISSVSFEGQEFESIYKNFFNHTSLVCSSMDEVIAKADVISIIKKYTPFTCCKLEFISITSTFN